MGESKSLAVTILKKGSIRLEFISAREDLWY